VPSDAVLDQNLWKVFQCQELVPLIETTNLSHEFSATGTTAPSR
jgi:hypothetical protein